MPERRSGAGSLRATERPRAGHAVHPGPRAPGRACAQQHYEILMRIVESEVLPRVLLSLGGEAQRYRQPRISPALSSAVPRFADILLYGDRCSAQAFLREVRQRGVPLAEIYVEVIAPTARMMCERWESDTCSFSQVSGGLIRLLSVLRDVGAVTH